MKSLTGVVVVGVALLVASNWLSYRAGRSIGSAPIVSFEKMANLAVLRVHIADVVDEKSDRYLSESKVLVKLKGDALVSVDMRKAVVTPKDEKTVMIVLPKPAVLSPRVDHDSANVYDSKNGWWAPLSDTQLLDQAYKDGQHHVEEAASSDESLDQARENAKQLVTEFCKLMGKEADVRWADQPLR